MAGPHLRRDGAPMSQFELAKGLAAAGWRILALSAEEGPLAAAYAHAGLALEIWPALRARSAVPGWYERDIERLAKRFAELSPDIVYANTLDMFPAIDAARLAGIESVWNIREGEDWRVRLADRHPAVAARALAAFAYPRAVIFVARSAATAWSAFTPAAASRVIYNAPAEIPQIIRKKNNAEGPFTLLSVGVLCARKSQIDLVEAFKKLPEGLRANSRMVFVGRDEDGYAARMKALLGVDADRAAFAGELLDIRPALAEAGALVHAAKAEAFPRVFLEAAAAHVPIIATRAGGGEERLTHGRSALFYDAGDIAALSRLIAQAIEDGGLRTNLAAGAHAALVAGWTHVDMIGAYDAAFRSLLAGAPELRDAARQG
jgi:glycosyltransferase involved in cell wall biosynthesis